MLHYAAVTVLVTLVSSIPALSASAQMLSVLPGHLAESGIPTSSEVGAVKKWAEVLACDKASKEPQDGWLDASLPFSFIYNGKASDAALASWKLSVKRSEKTGVENHLVVWNDPDTDLQVTWEIKRFTGFPAVEWVLRFKNNGHKNTPLIKAIKALDLRLHNKRPGCSFSVHAANGCRSQLDDLMPFTWQSSREKDTESFTLGGEFSSNKHMPFWNVETADSHGIAIGLGWTGNWTARFDVDKSAMTMHVDTRDWSFYLRPREEVRIPRILLVLWQGKPIHGQNMLRQVLYKHYLHPLKGEPQKPLVAVNTCFTHHGLGSFLTQASEQHVLSLVEPFAKIGAEAIVIDAGWYECKDQWGDFSSRYEIAKQRYPQGFEGISQALSRHNMDFGLWFAPEGLGHAGDHTVTERMFERVDHMVKNEGMTMYRQDLGIPHAPDEPDRTGVNEIRDITSLYALWDEIIRRYPKLVMEGCAGGGRRIDLETIQRFSWIQKSDNWFESNSDQCAIYGGSLFLPGGILNLPTDKTDDYTAWSSFGGQLCLAWHPLDADFPIDQAAKQVERYKKIRHLLCEDFYPLTECSLDGPWMAYQFHRSDLDSGVAMVFRRKGSDNKSFNLSLKGLDPKAYYDLYLEQSGRHVHYRGDILTRGIRIAVNNAPGADLIVYVRSRAKAR